MTATSEVIAVFREQHAQMRSMLESVHAKTGAERGAAFVALRSFIRAHEVVEHDLVHLVARRELPDGGVVVEQRLREEKDVVRALDALAELDVEGAAFETQFIAFQSIVLAHIDAEEAEEFDRINT